MVSVSFLLVPGLELSLTGFGPLFEVVSTPVTGRASVGRLAAAPPLPDEPSGRAPFVSAEDLAEAFSNGAAFAFDAAALGAAAFALVLLGLEEDALAAFGAAAVAALLAGFAAGAFALDAEGAFADFSDVFAAPGFAINALAAAGVLPVAPFFNGGVAAAGVFFEVFTAAVAEVAAGFAFVPAAFFATGAALAVFEVAVLAEAGFEVGLLTDAGFAAVALAGAAFLAGAGFAAALAFDTAGALAVLGSVTLTADARLLVAGFAPLPVVLAAAAVLAGAFADAALAGAGLAAPAFFGAVTFFDAGAAAPLAVVGFAATFFLV